LANTSVPAICDLHTSFENEYRALREEIVIFNRSDVGLLFLQGKDSLDFLNRLSTNHLLGLREDTFRSTILTTEKGRFIEVVTVIPYDDGYLLEVSPNNEERILGWLNKFVVMEDVKTSRPTPKLARASLAGFRLSSLVQHLGVSPTNDSREKVHHTSFGNQKIMVCEDSLFHGRVWNIYCQRKDFTSLILELTSSCLSFLGSKLEQAGSKVFETFRIEEGVPATGKELTEEVDPLEAGLRNIVSFTKGCYIGQEVIARLDTYKKVQRKLGAFASHVPMEGEGLILQDNTTAGWTTSHCYSPILNQSLALGYLKTNITKENLVLRIPRGAEYPITPVELPLSPV